MNPSKVTIPPLPIKYILMPSLDASVMFNSATRTPTLSLSPIVL